MAVEPPAFMFNVAFLRRIRTAFVQTIDDYDLGPCASISHRWVELAERLEDENIELGIEAAHENRGVVLNSRKYRLAEAGNRF